MDYPVIAKPPLDQFRVRPNLDDYERIRAGFAYPDVIKELDGLPGGGAQHRLRGGRPARRRRRGDQAGDPLGGQGRRAERYTYADARQAVEQVVANVLRSLGVKKGDRVFVFLDRIPELYAAVFGTLKAGCVIGPLFSAFGPDAVRDRLADSGAVGC